MRPSCLWIVAVALVLVGCESRAEPALYSVLDSVGIEIITVDASQQGRTFVVHELPEWRIGNGEAVQVQRIEDAVLLDNGTIVVADGGQQRIMVIDPQSGDSELWGGPGDGPEEFRGLARVFDMGDGRVGAYDRARRRFLTLDDGALLEEIPLPAITNTQDPPLLERLPRQTEEAFYLAARAGLPTEPGQGIHRGSGPVVRIHRTGQVDTLTTIAGNTTFWAPGMGGGPVPFGATTLLTTSEDGLWIGDTAEQEVALFRDASDPLKIVRWVPEEVRPLSEARVDSLWTAIEAGVPEAQRGMIRQLRQATPIPATMPAFGALHADGGRSLWIGSPVPPEVQTLQIPPPPQEWLVIDLESREVTRGTTPEGFRLLQVGGDRLIGVQVDATGVETIASYEFSWRDEL